MTFSHAQIAAMTTVEEAPEAADSESDADSFGKEFEEMLEDSDDEVRRPTVSALAVVHIEASYETAASGEPALPTFDKMCWASAEEKAGLCRWSNPSYRARL